MERPLIDIHTHSNESTALTARCVGIHPWQAEEHDLSNPDERKALELQIAPAQAVGEIGLDFAAEVDRDAQRELFVAQLKLAKKHKKVVVLHCVKSFDATMQLLSTFPLEGVILHGFIGSMQQMNVAVDRGYYISFGVRTFASPKTLRALRECPLDRLFIESDTSSTPIEEIYEMVSKYRMESIEELQEATFESYKRLKLIAE